MEAQTLLETSSRLEKFPILGFLMKSMGEQGRFALRTCSNGIELHFTNEVQGIPNRCYLRIYFPNESKCVLFFHKKSSIPFSHDRFSYGGVVIDERSGQRFSYEDATQWSVYLKEGMQPDKRPASLKKSIPFTIPED